VLKFRTQIRTKKYELLTHIDYINSLFFEQEKTPTVTIVDLINETKLLSNEKRLKLARKRKRM